jgi:hypothetical protein
MPFDEHNTMWQLSFPTHESDALLLMNEPIKLKAHALKQVFNWHDPLVQLIESTSEDHISGHPAYDRYVILLIFYCVMYKYI